MARVGQPAPKTRYVLEASLEALLNQWREQKPQTFFCLILFIVSMLQIASYGPVSIQLWVETFGIRKISARTSDLSIYMASKNTMQQKCKAMGLQ